MSIFRDRKNKSVVFFFKIENAFFKSFIFIKGLHGYTQHILSKSYFFSNSFIACLITSLVTVILSANLFGLFIASRKPIFFAIFKTTSLSEDIIILSNIFDLTKI